MVVLMTQKKKRQGVQGSWPQVSSQGALAQLAAVEMEAGPDEVFFRSDVFQLWG